MCSRRAFADEEQAGTLMALSVYGSSQAVLFGKGLFMAVLLFALSLLIVPVYLVLMDVAVFAWGLLLLTLLSGTYGMAMAGTLLSALMAGARAQNGLLSILMLPVLLPILLPAIVLTAGCFTGDVNGSYLVGMFLYDAIMTIAASLLFDFFWYED
ncbi:heme exporter protein CcmB [Mitsuokella jalaludinii]|uniref:heme exporter protein CcmB n=1 Tax=Mitsuokella jalaludinii TaxID=187979 RepID=UPI001D0189FC|nr:heme exporter protein CcmB [Mitsuokella jalaludinii]MCB5725071.1 heme exporter protein CcmB [Mitsuokella jalaludinii]